MIPERCSISSSTADATEMAASTAAPDRMVKTELEAAEALANLAQTVERGRHGHSCGEMPGKAKRDRRLVKCASPPSPAASFLDDSAVSPSDLAQDPAILFQQQDERILPNIAKTEQDDQHLDQSHICTTDYLSLDGEKSNQNLSEAEKEAKRFRRVLANRESARRTIRRRQALCVELARKTVELIEENEKLKEGKESALREHKLLESTNEKLKSEVEKLAKLEGERISVNKKAKASKSNLVDHINLLKPSQTEMLTTSPANLPVLLRNPPFAPFMWPTLFQSSSGSPSLMHGIPMIQASSNPSPPLYILPFPVFLGLPDQVHHCQSSCCLETTIDPEHLELINTQQPHIVRSSSRTTTPDGNPDVVEYDVISVSKSCLLGEVKFGNDLNEIPAESPPLDEGARLDHMTDAGIELHLSLSGQEYVSFPSRFSDVGVLDQDKKHEGSFLTLRRGKKQLVDVTAAADARRRRKELKKLKAIHGNQCRMRC